MADASPPTAKEEGYVTGRENPPHTLTGLVAMIAILFRTSVWTNPRDTVSGDLRAGLATASAVFLFYCTLQLQDGEVTRPHPVVWRFVLGITIIHLLIIVFLLTLSTTESIDLAIQTIFEPKSGTATLPKFEAIGFSEDCSLTWPNVQSKIDIFFVAHLFGWFVKALILRDWGMMWTCSLLFEVLEVTLQKILPNFQECWWDRWIMDVFGCNLMGMIIGMRVANWLGARGYDWWGTSQSKTKKILVRVLPRIFPRRFDWHTFASWRRFGISCLVIFSLLLGEVNGFLLKSSLRIPTESAINILRVLFLVPASYAAVVELYAYAEEKTDRVGRTAWLILSLCLLEFLLSMKNFILRESFSPDQLEFDSSVWIGWGGTVLMALLVALLKLTKLCSLNVIKIVGQLAALPFIYLLLDDAWTYGGLKIVFEKFRI